MESTTTGYYINELSKLRELSVEFARDNPLIAAMLGAESADPDVERLLEGVAFLNALTHQKLDEDFPEIAQELAVVLAPQITRPLPASTILQFTPKVPIREPFLIAAGTQIASIPIEGVQCLFRTTSDVNFDTIRFIEATVKETSDGHDHLSLSIERAKPTDTIPKLRLFLGEEFNKACEWFRLLATEAKSIRLVNEEGDSISVPLKITLPGFQEALLPYPDNAHPGFRFLQELLFFPQKFLFIEFQDLAPALSSMSGLRLRIDIDFGKIAAGLPVPSETTFLEGVSPGINLFECSADPILLHHEVTDYPVLPEGDNKRFVQVYTVNQVQGYRQGLQEPISYIPFSLLRPLESLGPKSYRLSSQTSVTGDSSYTVMSIPYGTQEIPTQEVLSINLTCTNRMLPEMLRPGDVSGPTSTSPERFTFANIKPVTPGLAPPQGQELLWAIIAHSAINLIALGDVENLKTIIGHYNFRQGMDPKYRAVNQRSIDGFLSLKVERELRLQRGVAIQGQLIELLVDETHWSSRGLLYLWGCVLDSFFAGYSAMNSYTRLEITDNSTGLRFKWPLRIGLKPLI